MTGRRVAGVALLIVGLVVLLWGGVFWTDRDTILDAGGLEIATEEREGFAVPPILGGVCAVAGAVLLLLPSRVRS